MSQPPRDQRDGQRQRRQQVPRREPEAEHRGGQEGGHDQLGAQRGGAEARGHLDPPDPGNGAREPVAQRAPQPPEAGEGECEHRRPAQQSVLAVEEERHQAIAALEVAAREGGVGGALAGDLGRVGRRPAVERLADSDEQRHAEQRQLDRADGERAPAGPPQSAARDHADHQARQDELGAEPGEGPEQGEAAEGGAPARPSVEPDGEQRGAGERGAGGQLGVDGAPVGQEGRAEADRQRGPDRPGIRHDPQGQPVGEHERQSCDGGEEELDAVGAAGRVGRQDEERKADPVRLVEATLGLLAVPVERVGVEICVGALGVLVRDVGVPVLHERLRCEQVVRLVAAVVGVAEGVEADGGRVDAEEEQPEGERAPHGPSAPLSTPARGRSPSAAPRRCPRRS
jgi:hypothetical protein